MKSALRINLSVSYGKITILLNYLPSADTPPIRLCRTSPASGGRINRSMLSCRNMAPWLSIHSATTKWWHQRKKRISSGEARLACFSPGESPVVRFYHKRAPSINLEAPSTTLTATGRVKLKPLKNLRPSGPSTLKPQRRSPWNVNYMIKTKRASAPAVSAPAAAGFFLLRRAGAAPAGTTTAS